MKFISGINLINLLCVGNRTSIKMKPTAIYTLPIDYIKQFIFFRSLSFCQQHLELPILK